MSFGLAALLHSPLERQSWASSAALGGQQRFQRWAGSHTAKEFPERVLVTDSSLELQYFHGEMNTLVSTT